MKISPHLIKSTPANAVLSSQQASLSMPVSQRGNAIAGVGSAITRGTQQVVQGLDKIAEVRGNSDFKKGFAEWNQKKIDIDAKMIKDRTLNTVEATNQSVDQFLNDYNARKDVTEYGKKKMNDYILNDRVNFVGKVQLSQAKATRDEAVNLHSTSFTTALESGNAMIAYAESKEAYESGIISKEAYDVELAKVSSEAPSYEFYNDSRANPIDSHEMLLAGEYSSLQGESYDKALKVSRENIYNMDKTSIEEWDKLEVELKDYKFTEGGIDKSQNLIDQQLRDGKISDKFYNNRKNDLDIRRGKIKPTYIEDSIKVVDTFLSGDNTPQAILNQMALYNSNPNIDKISKKFMLAQLQDELDVKVGGRKGESKDVTATRAKIFGKPKNSIGESLPSMHERLITKAVKVDFSTEEAGFDESRPTGDTAYAVFDKEIRDEVDEILKDPKMSDREKKNAVDFFYSEKLSEVELKDMVVKISNTQKDYTSQEWLGFSQDKKDKADELRKAEEVANYRQMIADRESKLEQERKAQKTREQAYDDTVNVGRVTSAGGSLIGAGAKTQSRKGDEAIEARQQRIKEISKEAEASKGSVSDIQKKMGAI